VFVAHDAVVDADPAPHAAAVVCTPNNPTGDATDPAALRAFAARCREAGTLLVVDEAFLEFTDRETVAGEPGVVVARSLTKVFGLPGLRMGFAVAAGEGLDRLEAARPAWALSTPAADVGAHCMRDTEFVVETRERVRAERERMREALATAFDVHPSAAPFLLLDVDDRDPDRLRREAREAGVVVRDATTFRGLDSHLRVAVRRPAENDRLLRALGVEP
jgi:histidinol-phosphate/aromatic aminotransferase/cobyric acid decarboxylase-like protein